MDKPFELLAELGKFSREHRTSLRDPKTIAEFLGHASVEIQRAIGDKALLHGHRTEAMFESLLLSLGQFQLLKAEDGGRCFPEDRYVVPDFRIVLPDGAHWLVEVKNVYETDPHQQHRRLLSPQYMEKLNAYAEATGAELKLAVYWARWSIWTLVSPSRLIGADGGVDLDMETAIRVNELSALGDRTIGTRPPLRLRVLMDPQRTSTIDAQGNVSATIGDTALYCDDQEITDPAEQKIAWLFIQHGDWREDEASEPIIEGDRLRAIDFRWNPEEPPDQGFAWVGTLSSMFARYYAQHTIESGAVVQLRAPLRLNWFKPLLDMGGGSRSLPLWQFSLQPNFDTSGDGHGQ